jgi:hypothetical protein
LNLSVDLIKLLWEFAEPRIVGQASVCYSFNKINFTQDLIFIGNRWFLNCSNSEVYTPDIIEVCAIQRNSFARPFKLKIDTITKNPYIIIADSKFYKVDRDSVSVVEIPCFSSIMGELSSCTWNVQDGSLVYGSWDCSISHSENGKKRKILGKYKSIDKTIHLTEDIKIVFGYSDESVYVNARKFDMINIPERGVPNFCVGDEFYFIDDERSKEEYNRLRIWFN